MPEVLIGVGADTLPRTTWKSPKSRARPSGPRPVLPTPRGVFADDLAQVTDGLDTDIYRLFGSRR